ncbi:MAG: heme exporter protein D [Phenylobacterium sp.]|jgi:heme exporter protein D
MAFESFADFLNMGGYAFYVWLAFGFSFVVLLTLTIVSVKKTAQIKAEVFQSLDREKRIKQAKEADLL